MKKINLTDERTITGLERLITDKDLQASIKGNIALLCHSASIDHQFNMGVQKCIEIFGERLKKIFGPQHGFVTDVQDNMKETEHYVHPYFKRPVYSLYSETRIPTDEMLAGIDTFIVDLQDVGTRVYTYISTLGLLLEKCQKKDIEIIILDRPNPVGGELVEGTLLKPEFKSFVGLYPIPQRHGLTMGEVALFGLKHLKVDVHVRVIEMKKWKRNYSFLDTHLPWVLPSPNLSTMDSAFSFVGSVLFEGTNVSEGRGTTRALEMVGFPQIESFSFCERVLKAFQEEDLVSLRDGFQLRPVIFLPTFQKHAGATCGGVQIHCTDHTLFHSWTVGQMLCREFYHFLGDQFKWNNAPYEYEFHKLAIDLINGTDQVRHWVEKKGTLKELKALENEGMSLYLNQRDDILLYR